MKRPADTDTTATDQVAERVRLVLPLMAKHRVPATPRNYAIWFEYVSEEKPDLNQDIDKLIAARSTFDDATLETLYQQHFFDSDLANFEAIRSDIGRILLEAKDSLGDALQSADTYRGHLDEQAASIDREGAENLDIKHLLQVLIRETHQMRQSTLAIRDHIQQKSTEIASLQEALDSERRKASTDFLTDLPNRMSLFNAMTDALCDGDFERPPALLMIDVDHFKRVNDKYGHLSGDRVLRFVADTLKRFCKGGDTAARYGGEEFAILLPNTGLQGAASLANGIRRGIAEARLVKSKTNETLDKVTVSIGIAVYQSPEDILDFVGRADRALYAAKQSGRNRVITEEQLPASARRPG